MTPEGHAQAQLLADSLSDKNISRIISSPYLRAVQSAAPLGERLGIEVELDPRLAERRLGQIEGDDWMSALRITFDDMSACWPEGESSLDASIRGRKVVDEALENGHLPVAVFTHGNLLTLLARSFDEKLGFEFWQKLTNPDVFVLSRVGDCCTLERMWR